MEQARANPRTPRSSSTTEARRPKQADPVLHYVEEVLRGAIVAGPLVRAACARHIRDLKNAQLVWRLDKAKRAIDFFAEVLCLAEGEHAEEPFILEGWEAFIVGSLFGWYTPDGFRRFRVGYVEVGKGNGKSPLAAGIGLYMLTSDGEKGAEVYAAAAVKEQAKIQYRDAVNMVELSEDLSDIIVKHGEKEVYNLVNRKTKGFFKPISSEKRGVDGKRVHCALIDELHEHPDSVVSEKMRAGTKGRRNGMIFEITNSGFDRTTICYQHHEYSERVVNGMVMDESWFAYVCGLDPDDDPFKDPKCWIKANPNLGVSIHPKYLKEQVREAKGMPAKESTVRRLNFCQWVDAAHPWIDGDLWRKCEQEFDFAAEVKGRPCFGGLDLSGTRDLTANATVSPLYDKEGKLVRVDAVVDFWTPGETLEERAKLDRVPYDVWVREGFVMPTPGRAVDYAFAVQHIAERKNSIDLVAIAFDPYRIKYFEKELADANVQLRLVPHGQGYFRSSDKEAKEKAKVANKEPPPDLWMPRSIELLEDLVMKGLLRVQYNPCLRWNSASAVLESDAKNNRIFNKRNSKGKIDGLVALAQAIGLALNSPEKPRKYQLMFV
jgi:phage terminase large subunit-like protein